MIPSSIQEIFGTLSVGILAAIIASAVWWIYVEDSRSFWKWAKRRFMPADSGGPMVVTLFLLLYGFAIVVENLTDHLTDTQKEYELTGLNLQSIGDAVPMLQTKLLGSEGHYRFESLFRKCRSSTLVSCHLRGLGREYFDGRLPFLTELAGNFEEFHAFIRGPVGYLQDDSLSLTFAHRKKNAIKFVNKLYYAAKNWAYAQSTYYDELQSIQRQIEYTRSSFLIATWGILVTWVAFLFGWLYHRYRSFDTAYMWSMQARRSATVTLVLFVIALLGRMGYAHTEVNFNERALGYFASYLQRENIGTGPVLYGLLANQWLQTSAEYSALALQTFNVAARAVTTELRKKTVNDSRVPAVILDLDETVIDNSKFQAYLLKSGKTYSPDLWAGWMQDGVTQAALVPGAADFIRKVEALKGTVVFISNRPDTEQGRRATIDTLRNLGISVEGLDRPETLRLLLKSDTSSKGARRQQVAKKYRVVAFVGDVLGDFAEVFDPVKGISTVESRRNDTLKAQANWGRNWFILPNPTYGQWQEILNEREPITQLRIWAPSTQDP